MQSFIKVNLPHWPVHFFLSLKMQKCTWMYVQVMIFMVESLPNEMHIILSLYGDNFLKAICV